MTMTKQDKWVFAKEMVDKGHTQTAVADMLNVSKTTITSYLFKAKYEIEARERAKNPLILFGHSHLYLSPPL